MSTNALSHKGSRVEPSFDAGRPPAAGEGPRGPAGSAPARRVYGPLVVGIVALAIAAASFYAWMQTSRLRQAAPPPPASAPQATAPEPAAAPSGIPGPRHPIPEMPAAEGPPLPVIAASDGPLAEALAALFGRTALDRYLVPEELVRHIVATVDNLPRKTYAQRLSPVKPVPGAYAAGKVGDQLAVAPSQPRYAPYVDALVAVDAQRLVALYVHWYPLFQQAYRDLGYPQGHFNDRLVEAIDVMLATPEPKGTLALVQPKVVYEFADPAVEALPAGQKLVLRMGPENARHVKAKLAEIRRLVVAQKP